MSDFTSSFWSWFIIAITVGGFIWMLYLLLINNKSNVPANEVGKPTGHVWDEDLEELNNPLPRWWLIMFYITIVFGVVYLALYPGLGSFKGLLGWTEVGEYQAEVDAATEQYAGLYDGFMQKDVAALAADDSAMKTGERLFVNYCSVCHGSDARGARGFPNLRDNDWLYGGTPEAIKASIMAGRTGSMPAWEAPLGGAEGVADTAAYVMQLAGRQVDAAAAKRGEAKYNMFCTGCHMPGGTGNIALGAPNLSNNVWLYGGSPRAIQQTIAKGRSGVMPPHGDFLGEAKVHVLAAYIYSLSHETD
jgi:cytochrome c oxidase cbb3-type subunit 3